jgi:FkbM family methyltransferase
LRTARGARATGESRRIALKRTLRSINRRFPSVGLPKPSRFLIKHGLMPRFDTALSSLGIREYSRVRFPVNGSSFMVTVRSAPFWESIENKEFEPNCIDYLSDVISEGSRILDVGAGYGAYALLFSKLAGDRGEVHAFEPDPVCRDVLHDHVRRNHLANVRVQDMCVSRTPGTVVLRSRTWGNGRSTIMGYLQPEPPLKRIVGTTTIDRYCSETGFRPDGLKIDVEGAEGLVLAGASRTIEECSPWILLEFHGGFMSPEERKANWLLATGLARKVIFLDGDSRLHSFGDELDSMPDCPSFHVFLEH